MSVKFLKFSIQEDYIFTLDASDKHNIHVFDAENGTLVDSMSTGNDIIFDMDKARGKYAIILATNNGCKFVRFENNVLNQTNGEFGQWI